MSTDYPRLAALTILGRHVTPDPVERFEAAEALVRAFVETIQHDSLGLELVRVRRPSTYELGAPHAGYVSVTLEAPDGVITVQNMSDTFGHLREVVPIVYNAFTTTWEGLEDDTEHVHPPGSLIPRRSGLSVLTEVFVRCLDPR